MLTGSEKVKTALIDTDSQFSTMQLKDIVLDIDILNYTGTKNQQGKPNNVIIIDTPPYLTQNMTPNILASE